MLTPERVDGSFAGDSRLRSASYNGGANQPKSRSRGPKGDGSENYGRHGLRPIELRRINTPPSRAGCDHKKQDSAGGQYEAPEHAAPRHAFVAFAGQIGDIASRTDRHLR